VFRTSQAHSLVYMSVPKPDLFTAALSNHFSPSTTFLGLVAAPTHFITNRPVTLFFDDRVYGDGSVGLALVELKIKRNKYRSWKQNLLEHRNLVRYDGYAVCTLVIMHSGSANETQHRGKCSQRP